MLITFSSNFKAFNPRYPFEYDFLDQSYASLYERESNMGALADYFAVVAVFISLLGFLDWPLLLQNGGSKKSALERCLEQA